MSASASRPLVAVIGGGVIGTSAAWQIAATLGRRAAVMLLEAKSIGSGSTSRAVGEVETQYLALDDIQRRVTSMQVLSQLEAVGRIAVHRNGYLRLARSEDALSAMETSVELQHGLGAVSAQLVTPNEIQRLVPGIDVEGVSGGLYGPNDGHVDPYGLAQCFCQLARENGAQIGENTPVISIEHLRDGRYRLQTGRHEPILADVIVNAAGSWAGQLNRSVGVELPVVGYRHQVATFEVPAEYPDVPFTMDFLPGSGQPGVYFRKEGSQRLVAGLHDDHLEPTTIADPDRYPTGVDPDFVDVVVTHLASVLPELQDQLAFVGGWSGLYPFTPSAREEILDVNMSGYIVAVGFGGVGIQLSPWAGIQVAALVRDALNREGHLQVQTGGAVGPAIPT